MAASSLAKSKGAPIPGYRDMSNRPEKWVSNLEVALNGGKKMGVNPILDARYKDELKNRCLDVKSAILGTWLTPMLNILV